MSFLSEKWRGPVLCGTGGILLAFQVYAFVSLGLISLWLSAGGFALLLIGAASWVYYLDDRRAGLPVVSSDEFPSPEEFEERLLESESGDVDV